MWRASLSRERERERETGRERKRERERAEAGREPGSPGLRLPKYWDYKHAPPRPAMPNFCVCVWNWNWGLNPGAFYLRSIPPALFFILYFETGSHEAAEGLTK